MMPFETPCTHNDVFPRRSVSSGDRKGRPYTQWRGIIAEACIAEVVSGAVCCAAGAIRRRLAAMFPYKNMIICLKTITCLCVFFRQVYL